MPQHEFFFANSLTRVSLQVRGIDVNEHKKWLETDNPDVAVFFLITAHQQLIFPDLRSFFFFLQFNYAVTS